MTTFGFIKVFIVESISNSFGGMGDCLLSILCQDYFSNKLTKHSKQLATWLVILVMLLILPYVMTIKNCITYINPHVFNRHIIVYL